MAVPSIPTTEAATNPVRRPADVDLRAVVAGLTVSQRQSLLQILTQAVAV
jgi:hypothetical protein